MFIHADQGSGDQYVIPAKAANESTIRLLLADRQHKSLTVYTDGFRAYEPLDEDDAFTRESCLRSFVRQYKISVASGGRWEKFVDMALRAARTIPAVRWIILRID